MVMSRLPQKRSGYRAWESAVAAEEEEATSQGSGALGADALDAPACFCFP
jgi:hypothetical protein